jgi:hypothetical protein
VSMYNFYLYVVFFFFQLCRRERKYVGKDAKTVNVHLKLSIGAGVKNNNLSTLTL